MQRLYPDPTAIADPASIYDELHLRLPDPPPGRPRVALNMVTSADGKAAVDGSTVALGSALDHRLMRAIRAVHDAVLNGAGTLRAERLDPRVGPTWAERRRARGVSPEPLAVLLTRSGDLPLDRRYFQHAEVERIVLAGADLPDERRAALAARARLILAPTPDPDLAWIMGTLRRDLGVRHLLVEGGPTVNGALLAAGLVDELFWTVAPKLVGGGESLTLVEGPPLPAIRRLVLLSAYLHEDELFLRYRVEG
jgi:riboflavin-specific deaminase-like protein